MQRTATATSMAPPQDQPRNTTSNQQHQRFSWQPPPETPPEIETQAQRPNHSAQSIQHIAPLNTNVETHHNRVFSYAQTPAEHLAFQYIPSSSEPVPPLPQLSHSPQSATPIDPRPQSMFPIDLHNHPAPQPLPAVPHPSYPSRLPTYERKPPVSPLSPHGHIQTSPSSPVSPSFPVPSVGELPRVYTQASPQHSLYSQHARNLSNLSPLNTNVGVHNTPPDSLLLGAQTYTPTYKVPLTPTTPGSIRKDPPDMHPTPLSYAHGAYSPHNTTSATHKTPGGIFSPDSAHGPNGLDFALHQPGQVAHPNMDLSSTDEKRPWSSSLCSISSDCLTGLFCPCILHGRTSYRLSQKSAKRDPTDLLSHSATNGHCLMMALSCGFWWVYPFVQRTRVRHIYKLEGGVAGDCLRAACCCCCTTIQNEKEVKSREEAKRQLAGPGQGYKSVGQMMYAPQ